MTNNTTAIATNHGAAYIHSPHMPIDQPVKHFGIIIVGNRLVDAVEILAVSRPAWVALHYSCEATEVVWSAIASVQVGDRVEFDESLIPKLNCPRCGGKWIVSKGINWHCQECQKDWRKSGNKQVGRPRKDLLKS